MGKREAIVGENFQKLFPYLSTDCLRLFCIYKQYQMLFANGIVAIGRCEFKSFFHLVPYVWRHTYNFGKVRKVAEMNIERICVAYSTRDDESLHQALQEFQIYLMNLVHFVGPCNTMLQTQTIKERLLPILNKISAEAETATNGKLAFVAGFLSAQLDLLESLVSRQETNTADALLSSTDNQTLKVRIMLLKICFTSIGTRSTRLVNLVADTSRVSKGVVKFHLSQLVEMKLLNRIQQGPKVVCYYLTRLGESVVARQCHPYEVGLLCIDIAALDSKMRSAMREEIRRTWPPEK